MNLPNKKYQIIYADPPWSYRDKCNAGKRGASHKYSCMELSDLMQLQIKQLAADDCVLFMWHVAPMPMEALKVMEAWGFKLKTMKGFTWVKLNKRFSQAVRNQFSIEPEQLQSMTDDQILDLMGKLTKMGMGSWTRANTEDVLVATRGNAKRINAGVKQVVFAPIGEHSAKPPEVRDRIVQLMGDVPRIELFARENVDGWDCWGDEL